MAPGWQEASASIQLMASIMWLRPYKASATIALAGELQCPHAITSYVPFVKGAVLGARPPLGICSKVRGSLGLGGSWE